MLTFIDKFNKVALKVKNINLGVVIHYTITTLRSRPFADDMWMSPTSMDD